MARKYLVKKCAMCGQEWKDPVSEGWTYSDLIDRRSAPFRVAAHQCPGKGRCFGVIYWCGLVEEGDTEVKETNDKKPDEI